MKTSLLVIDAQRIYTDPESDLFCADAKATMRRINTLIGYFQKRKKPVVFVRHVHKLDGSDLGRLFDFTGESDEDFNFKKGSPEVEYDPTLMIPRGSTEIVKNRYSGFAGTSLAKTLRKKRIVRVAVCGFMTNFCCESTARAAHDLDFYVDFIPDATGTPGTENLNEKAIRKVVGELLGSGFARVFTTKQYLSLRK